MAIIENGIFTIPLYHGTTGLFVDSIKQYGLGEKDPLVDLKAKEFMDELYELAEKQKWKDGKWIKAKELLQPIVLQENIENTLNFKHGETYVTYSPEIATKYAKENPFGCEYLTYLRILMSILIERNVKGLQDRFIDKPVLKEWETPNNPYLITLNNVKLENVVPEADQDLAVHIEEIEKLLSAGIYGPHSFKLKKPISVDELIVKKIGTWDAQAQNLTEE